MKTYVKYSLLAIIALLTLSLAVCGGLTAPVRAGTTIVTAYNNVVGKSTCYVGGVEGSAGFTYEDLADSGIETFRIYGGMGRWEWQDDDGVYGSPTIAEIEADPNVVNWAWWDDVMTNPPEGSDYHWAGDPPDIWEGNARTIFQTLKDLGIAPVVTLRQYHHAEQAPWAPNPPTTDADWNEWWEHCFATAYWLNVRNDYRVDHYEVHNEPDNSSQGWAGTMEEYMVFVQYTYDAIKHVYDAYLPGREFHVLMPSSLKESPWLEHAINNIPNYFTDCDHHCYGGSAKNCNVKVNEWLDGAGIPGRPIWISEWGTWTGSYDSARTGVDLILGNLLAMAEPTDAYTYGSHLFAFYPWGADFDGLISTTGERLHGYYAMRMGVRGAGGCRTSYQVTSSDSKVEALVTEDDAGAIYVLVINNGNSRTIDVDISALLTSGTGTMWMYNKTYKDDIVGTPALDNGHVVFDVDSVTAVTLKFDSGSPPPTDTPAPPTDTPEPPTDTPVPPTDTPAPPTATPGSGTNLALGKPTEVTSVQEGHPGSHAVDGDLLTFWRTVKMKRNEPRPPEWITVDLGASTTISQVVLEWNTDYSRYATSYTIDVSPDNTNWNTVYSTTSGDGGTDVIGFSATSARYVRMYSTVWTVEWEGNYLSEFEIYQ